MTHAKRRSVLAMTTSLKGGTGKSFFASVLLDILRHRRVPVAAFDADGAIGALSAMHAARDAAGRLRDPQDAATGVVAYNIRDDSRTTLIDSLGCPEPLILHDLAGGSLADLQRLFDDRDGLHNFLRTAERLGITLVFFQGLSLREAGERMGGRSEDAVRMMLRRAEGRLGDLLKRTLGRDMD